MVQDGVLRRPAYHDALATALADFLLCDRHVVRRGLSLHQDEANAQFHKDIEEDLRLKNRRWPKQCAKTDAAEELS